MFLLTKTRNDYIGIILSIHNNAVLKDHTIIVELSLFANCFKYFMNE